MGKRTTASNRTSLGALPEHVEKRSREAQARSVVEQVKPEEECLEEHLPKALPATRGLGAPGAQPASRTGEQVLMLDCGGCLTRLYNGTGVGFHQMVPGAMECLSLARARWGAESLKVCSRVDRNCDAPESTWVHRQLEAVGVFFGVGLTSRPASALPCEIWCAW